MFQEPRRAEAFLERHELRLSVKYLGDDRPQHRDDEMKRPHYLVTIRRIGGPKLSYDFWESTPRRLKNQRSQPRIYDILEDLNESSKCSENPDEVYKEFGEMKPSQAMGMARFARRLRKFFTQQELTELRDMVGPIASPAVTVRAPA